VGLLLCCASPNILLLLILVISAFSAVIIIIESTTIATARRALAELPRVSLISECFFFLQVAALRHVDLNVYYSRNCALAASKLFFKAIRTQ
jgi:hypothetical protein